MAVSIAHSVPWMRETCDLFKSGLDWQAGAELRSSDVFIRALREMNPVEWIVFELQLPSRILPLEPFCAIDLQLMLPFLRSR